MSGFALPAGLRPAPNPGQGAGPSGSSSALPHNGGSGPSDEEREAAQARQEQQEEMKRGMIAAMLEPEARERLSRISLTRPQLVQQVEALLIRMGQNGQVRGQISDDALKGLLAQVSNPPPVSRPPPQPVAVGGKTKSLGGGITIQRKRDDSDSDEYDL